MFNMKQAMKSRCMRCHLHHISGGAKKHTLSTICLNYVYVVTTETGSMV